MQKNQFAMDYKEVECCYDETLGNFHYNYKDCQYFIKSMITRTKTDTGILAEKAKVTK